MRVISNRPLREFAVTHPDADSPLQTWRRHVKSRPYLGFADIKNTFGSADIVGKHIVFDIRGNRYRLVALVRFEHQICYVRAILTHSQYDKGHWMKTTQVREASGHGWGPFEHPSTVRSLATEADHNLALSVIDRLVNEGAMTDSGHPQSELFELLFDAIYSYEEVHLPF